MKIISCVIIILFLTSTVLACGFDTDCDAGSKCYIPRGSLYGWCVGGLNPGNQNDRQPAYDPLDITKKGGNTCSFDTDCGVGGRCIKGYGIYGTCF